MFRLLYKYLIFNKEASVPGVGVFFIKRKPARLDFVNKIFVAPAFQIGFRQEPIPNDNRIRAFISREQKIDVSQAQTNYHDFADGLRKNLSEHKTVDLPGMGVLSQNAEGNLTFKETIQVNNYFPDTAADRLLRENVEHHVLVGDIKRTNKQMKEALFEEHEFLDNNKDYWWIFAIALGIIGIASIVYYYLHNGTLR